MKLPYEHFSIPVFRRHIIAVAAIMLCSGQAWAINPFVVKDIRVEGIQRTEAGTVFSYLPVRVGDTFTDEKSTTAIKALYATGFFKDVRIEVEGNVLVVQIEERPAIASVEITGTKEFEKDVLIKSLKELGLGESRIFDKSLLDRAEQELKRQYLSRGLYGVQITTTVTPIERNRVKINFSVDEGDVSRIKQIKFIGNKVFSDSDLLNEIKLTTPGWFTWYTKADQYSKQKLAGDIETLKSFYLNRGYIEMQVESTQVSITPDKKDIYITINISEGEKYTVSDVKLEGSLFGREAELQSLLQLKKGDVYSGVKLADSVKKISERLGNYGYAFANVNANPELNRTKKEAAFTIFIDPGKRVYVRRVNITGNSITRDEVIRRELREYEDSWYDGQKIKLSKERVDRLGYFGDVNIETPEVPGTTDQVDINMSVTEKPTGNISLGAGFSTAEKLTLSGSIQQANAFGSGNTIGLDVNTSKINRTIVISQTNPYFTDDGVSRTYDLYVRTNRPALVDTGNYAIKSQGGDIKFGVPFTELDTVFFGVGVENTHVETDITSPSTFLTYVNDFGNWTTSFPLTVGWQRDSRDSPLIPSTGRYQRANLEVSAFGDLQYYRTVYQHQYYVPVTRSTTLALNGEFDYGRSLGSKPYPVFKNFYAGGIGSVRGYNTSSIGPHDPTTNDPIGGAARVIANAELQLPFSAGADRSLRWFTFFDAGNVYGADQAVRPLKLRTSVGFGISWVSPLGPLKFSYGRPLKQQPYDDVQRLQFQIGTGF